jgi:hypothetical protein
MKRLWRIKKNKKLIDIYQDMLDAVVNITNFLVLVWIIRLHWNGEEKFAAENYKIKTGMEQIMFAGDVEFSEK